MSNDAHRPPTILIPRMLWTAGLLAGLLGGSAAPLAAQDEAGWQQVRVPEVWKKPPAGRGGYSWYRCLVKVPPAWRGRPLSIFLEPVDDAREVYLNGEKVAEAGSFPPRFRSGLGAPDRHDVAEQQLRFGELNSFAVRIYNSDGRSGFNVAAPAIFAGEQAMHLAGAWQFRPGDDASWSRWDAAAIAAGENFVFSQIQPGADVDAILRRLPGEEGPLSVAESLPRFETPDDLMVEAAVSEPDIGQPLFIEFDERGRMWVLNYKQYPSPAGLTAISRDKFLRTVYDRTPLPPPNHVPGRDTISIHEDTNGDGVFDRRQEFVSDLNIATSFARGRGGVFVLNPPYLLFYPDEEQNDVPDGPPQVLLEGFGIEDSHSVANNLRWGPDGWLYAAQGSTVTGQIKRYGSNDPVVHSMGQLIWRYHPETFRYEIFAEGGGNAFGVEIDAKGRIFSGHNGGDTRGFHYVQGGYYQKGFGKHGELSNPYAFGYFSHVKHHSVPRFTHQFVIYEGAALSAQYAGRLFGVGPLQSHVVYSDVQPLGATFQTKDLGYALASSDPWFRPVAIKVGPDGAIYVCDFHEQRIDHASHYQGRVTPDTGRIYRLRSEEAETCKPFDYSRLASRQLVELLRHENKWHRQIALRLLGDRRDASVIPLLLGMLEEGPGQTALEALWALNLSGGFDDTVARRTLAHPDPHVRAWTVRLLADEGDVSSEMAASLRELARTEPDVEVRCQLACSARRLPADEGLAIVSELLARDEDADDPFLPLLLWWAIEARAEGDREAVLAMFGDPAVWKAPLVRDQILERLMRRYAQAGGRRNLLTCAELFERAPERADTDRLMKGFEVAFKGRTVAAIPESLATALTRAGGGSLDLRLRRGDDEAVAAALEIIQDEQQTDTDRVRYVQVFGQIDRPQCVPVLLQLAGTAKSSEVRNAAIASLQAYVDPQIGEEIVRLHNDLPTDVRSVAQSLLASRSAWTGQFVAAVDRGEIDVEAVPADIVQRMLLHNDPPTTAAIGRIWGDLQTTDSEALREEVARLERVISAAAGNPYRGRELFREHCGKCHVLYTDGGQIGPNLTSYKRDDLQRMLLNIVHPSLEIREGYENFIVFTADGRSLSGFVADQDNRVVVLKGADGQSMIVSRDEIDEMQAIPRSLMPERVLEPLDEQQVRDLFAYLRSTQPLP